jgi:hypothetical protein
MCANTVRASRTGRPRACPPSRAHSPADPHGACREQLNHSSPRRLCRCQPIRECPRVSPLQLPMRGGRTQGNQVLARTAVTTMTARQQRSYGPELRRIDPETGSWSGTVLEPAAHCYLRPISPGRSPGTTAQEPLESTPPA